MVKKKRTARSALDPRDLFDHQARNLSAIKMGNVQELHIHEVEWARNEQGAFIPKRVPNSDRVLQAELVLLAMGFWDRKIRR